MSFPKAAADASLQKTDKGDLILLRGCENTSLELQKLLQAAADVVKDFGGDVKVEFPRYRCLSCKQYFPLASYRKVAKNCCLCSRLQCCKITITICCFRIILQTI